MEPIQSIETFDLKDDKAFKEYLAEQLKTYNVNGISGAIILPTTYQADFLGGCEQKTTLKSSIVPFVAGKSDVERNTEMDSSTWLQFASISKTVGTAYGIELFLKLNISLDSPVNDILSKYGSPFKLLPTSGSHSWGDEVTFRMLLSHTAALGMHYVNGIPLSEDFPPVLDLLRGEYEQAYGYGAVSVHSEPGLHFAYSGASFLVLQHVLEIIENKNVSDGIRLFIQDADGRLFNCKFRINRFKLLRKNAKYHILRQFCNGMILLCNK